MIKIIVNGNIICEFNGYMDLSKKSNIKILGTEYEVVSIEPFENCIEVKCKVSMQQMPPNEKIFNRKVNPFRG